VKDATAAFMFPPSPLSPLQAAATRAKLGEGAGEAGGGRVARLQGF
jgi:hypothetical protein